MYGTSKQQQQQQQQEDSTRRRRRRKSNLGLSDKTFWVIAVCSAREEEELLYSNFWRLLSDGTNRR
jgi:ribosomal protein L20